MEGYGSSYPSWINEIYGFWRFWPPPPPLGRKRNVGPSWEKNLNTPLLISLKICLVLNYS